MRKGNLADGPAEIIWTCTEVLAIDPSSAKAHYVRALARAELDDSASLELAVKDLARANALAPNDRAVRDAMRTYGAAHTRRRPPRTGPRTGRCLGRGTRRVYTREELERAAASGGSRHERGRFRRRRGPGAQGAPEHVGGGALGQV